MGHVGVRNMLATHCRGSRGSGVWIVGAVSSGDEAGARLTHARLLEALLRDPARTLERVGTGETLHTKTQRKGY